MKISLHPSFSKSYKKRIANSQKLVDKTTERINIFRQNRGSPLLKDHSLTGSKKDSRAFSVTGDIRIVYFLDDEDHAIFLDIGSHNQVY